MVGEISGQRSLRRESVRSGDYAVGEMCFWELSIGDLEKVLVGELSGRGIACIPSPLQTRKFRNK